MTNATRSVPGSWLTTAELSPHSLDERSTLARAVELFRADSDLRLPPVVGQNGRPLGAIFEKDVRRLLLNPFGHALLQNPTFGANLSQHIRPCPVHEMTDHITTLVDHYHRSDGRRK